MAPGLLFQVFAMLMGVTVAIATNPTRPHFDHWFPMNAMQYEAMLHGECSSDYQIYLDDQHINYLNPNDTECSSCAIVPVATCLYDNTTALTNANTQAAGVLLGLLPTILIFVTTSKVETGILALRRPLLACLVSAGTPAVNPLRSADYSELAHILHSWPGSMVPYKPVTSFGRASVVALEYCVVLAAIANIAEVSYELGYWAVCSVAPETTYLPMLWPSLTLVGHILGATAGSLRVRLIARQSQESRNVRYRPLRAKLRHWVDREFRLSSAQDPESLTPRQETYVFLAVNLWLSTLALMHIILGTIVLSGTLFIPTTDAAIVASRYVASMIACRVVLTYELCGLRQVLTIQDCIPSTSAELELLKERTVWTQEVKPLVRLTI